MTEVTYLRLRNRTSRTIDLFWLDHGNAARFHAQILPGRLHTQAATPGRPWTASNPDGSSLGTWYPDAQPRTIVLADWGAHLKPLVIEAPEGYRAHSPLSGAVSPDRAYADGRIYQTMAADLLDELDAADAYVQTWVKDNLFVQAALHQFPEAQRAAAYAGKLLDFYREYQTWFPKSSVFDVPDGYGYRLDRGAQGGSTSAWFAVGSVAGRLQVSLTGDGGDIALARTLAARQRQRL